MFNQVIKRSRTSCCWITCSESESVIWETNDPTKYASKVFSDRSAETVSIYLMNGEILHFEKLSRKKPWLEISHRINLFVNQTSSTIFFDFVHDGEKRTFTAKPGYLFRKVILAGDLSNKIFWEAEKDEECSTKVVVYGVESTIKNVNVFLNNDRVVHSHKVSSDWITTTLFVLDIGKNSDNDLFDYRSTRGFGHFNPKANLKITDIVKGYRKIWTRKHEYGLKVVLMGAKKEEKYLSILLEGGDFELLYKSGQGKPWQNITQSKHNFHEIRMFSLDEATSKHKELTTDDYEPIVYESRYGYEVNDGVKCVMITNGDMLMWNHTEDPEFGYPKGLYLDLPRNTFSVKNLKGQSKMIDVCNLTVKVKVPPKVTPEAVSEVEEVTPVVKAPMAAPVVVAVPGPDIVRLYSSKSGELKCTVTKDFDDFDYDLQGLECELITHEGNCVWKHETGKPYPKYMSYNEEDSKVVVSFEDDYYICWKEGNQWKTQVRKTDGLGGGTGPSYPFGDTSTLIKSYNIISTGDTGEATKAKPITAPAVTAPAKPAGPIPVTLDIENTESTNEYEYKEENEVVTYTGKAGHVFSKVSEGEYDIWDTVDDVYGTLVRTKTTRGVNFLVILMTNDTFKLFQEREEDWLDVTADRHDVTKLKFFGEGDKVLKRTDYDINIIDMSFSHTFKDGVKCLKVMLGNEVVWKSDDDPKFPWITVFSLGVASNSFFIKNQSGDVKKIEPKTVVEEEDQVRLTIQYVKVLFTNFLQFYTVDYHRIQENSPSRWSTEGMNTSNYVKHRCKMTPK